MGGDRLLPRVSNVLRDDTHRLIPARYTDRDESVLGFLTDDPDELNALFELEGATNDRLLGEAGLLPGITVRELVFGLSYSHIVNAAFTHVSPFGSRSNGPERGAWYAAFTRATSALEVAYHKSKELQEISWQEKETFTYVDFLADFRGTFHDIRNETKLFGRKQLQHITTFGQRTSRGRVSRGRLSERSAQSWNMHRLFQARSREQCPERLVHLHHF